MSPSATLNAIGLLETTSIGIGFLAEDAMLKAAAVELLVARTICSGKYLVVVGGDVAAVTASVEAGATEAEGALIEQRIIPRVHADVFPAISMAAEFDAAELRALGIIETFSAASIVEVADAAAKAADVRLLRVHLAMAVGGKGFVLLSGEVAAAEAAVAVGAAVAAEEGILVSRVVIPAPSAELMREII